MVSKKQLEDFVKRFRKVSKRKSLRKQAEEIIQDYKIPERYLEGFEDEDLFERKIELVKKKKQSPKERLSPLKTDIKRRKEFSSGKKKRVKSPCIEKLQERFPGNFDSKRLSKQTGVPKDIIDKVDEKGKGAFLSSGSRPGQTASSWGKARAACFLTKKSSLVGPKSPDRKLYEEAIRKSPKAKKYFSGLSFWS